MFWVRGLPASEYAGDGVRVEEVVEAQSELGLVEAAAAAERVVDVGVCDVETGDRGLVVVCAVVEVLLADALVEEGDIPTVVLVGCADGFDVAWSLLDPQTGGCGDVDLRRGGSTARAGVATDVQVSE